MKSDHDSDGVIGDKPKPKDQTEGLGLFDAARDESAVLGKVTNVREEGGEVVADLELNDKGRQFLADIHSSAIVEGGATQDPSGFLDGGEDMDDEDEDSGWAINRDHADSLWDSSDPPCMCGNPKTNGPHDIHSPHGCSVRVDPEDNPTDPTKPPAPTDAERMVAIERVKSEIVDALLAIADKRRGLPLAQAGVTAEDARALADTRPEAVLVGSKGRAWSWLGPWLASLARAGKLAAFRVEGVPVTRRSNRDKAHGNAHAVYLHPLDARAPGQPRAGFATAAPERTVMNLTDT